MHVLALVLTMAAGVFWASSGIAAQHLFQHSPITAMELTTARLFTAGWIILLLSAWKGKLRESLSLMKKEPRLWKELIFYGVIGLMAMQFTYFQSIADGNAAAATVIQYTSPAMVICWSAWSARRLPAKAESLAVILAVGGTFFLVTGGDVGRLSVPLACVAWGLISAVFFSIAAIYPQHLFLKLAPYFLLSMGMLIGAVSSWCLSPMTDLSPFFAPDAWFDVVWIILIGTAAAFLCFNTGLQYLSATEAMITATVEPAASVFMACLLFGQSFGEGEMLGIIMVIGAIALPGLGRALTKKRHPAKGNSLQ